MNEWKLIEVTSEPEWIEDASGVYVVVHRVEEKDVHKGIAGIRIFVRVDLMRKDDNEPIRSWKGKPDAVQKAVMQWIDWESVLCTLTAVSIEHAAYIGSEITRAALDPRYIQS